MIFGSRRNFDQDPFTDLLFNILIAFTLLFFLVIVFVNPPAEKGIIDPKAEIIITIKWQDNSPDDIDLWIENPQGEIVWFMNPEAGFIHLDRDDRGLSNDTIIVNDEKIINPINQEVATIRNFVKGEYVVNLHYYKSESGQAVDTEVRVIKVNPVLEVLFYDTIRLNVPGEEKTAVRFHVDKNGVVSRMNTLSKSIVTLGSLK